MGLIRDPDAEKRSLMLKQKTLCDGQKNGRACACYWEHWEKVDSHNPDSLRKGEIFRVCIVSPAIAHEMTADQVATECNQYRPMKLAWYLRPLAWIGLIDDPGRYRDTATWNPMTPEEIKKLEEKTPLADELVQLNKTKFQAEVEEKQKELSLDDAINEMGEDQGIFAEKGE